MLPTVCVQEAVVLSQVEGTVLGEHEGDGVISTVQAGDFVEPVEIVNINSYLMLIVDLPTSLTHIPQFYSFIKYYNGSISAVET